jgi:hypothetical protein
MVGLGAGGLERRYVALRATRWLPAGLVIPVRVLLLTSRGLSLGQIGVGHRRWGPAVRRAGGEPGAGRGGGGDLGDGPSQ